MHPTLLVPETHFCCQLVQSEVISPTVFAVAYYSQGRRRIDDSFDLAAVALEISFDCLHFTSFCACLENVCDDNYARNEIELQ